MLLIKFVLGCFTVGFSFISFAWIFSLCEDHWLKKQRLIGYDSAIRDIIEYNIYYDTDDKKHKIKIEEID